MTDTDRIARLERLVKTLMRGIASGTRRVEAAEYAAALAWVNSDDEPKPIIEFIAADGAIETPYDAPAPDEEAPRVTARKGRKR